MMRPALAFAIVAALVPAVSAQQPVKGTLAGVQNYAHVETTVACAGAVDPDAAMPEIKKLGFASVVNLRQASEPGANVEAEKAAAEHAGLKYFHVPVNGAAPDPKSADAFLAALRTPGAEPAFIHCATGNRAAAMWLIKRIVVDHWDADKAAQEAAGLGLTSAPLRQFALDYAASHK
ncbi:MAG TPA: sulfur transferase domain-containing protein [Vicinamibacterales bacterium]|nr:sulfur transferase domain-containing protein [Vicinamibacterales bacterium]